MGKPKEKGASSPASSGDSSSLLDFDLKNDDFLNSWKPKSGGEANLMDIDFGSPVKRKNKTFAFDKMDMDFNLDSGFGKLSSFSIDMPDLDVSSPLKGDGKHKDKSKDAFDQENNKGKADKFDFSFDFMDFNFKSDAKKKKKNVEDEDNDGPPKKDDDQGAKIQQAEEIGGVEVGLSENPTVSGNSNSSNTRNLHGGIDSDSTKEAVPNQSMIKENGPSENLTVGYVAAASGSRNHDSTEGNLSTKSTGYDDTLKDPTAENVATLSGILRTTNGNAHHVGGDPKPTNESISLKSSGNDNSNTKLQTKSILNKTLISTEIQQTDCQADETSPGGAITHEVGSSNPVLEHSVHSTSGADSGEHTGMFQEEDILISITVSGGEQDDHENVTADSGSRNEEVVMEKSTEHIANAESQHLIEVHDVKDNMEGLESVQSNPDLKCSPKITTSSQMLPGGRINEDQIINVPMPSTSRTKVDSAIPASEGLITRSKYFTGSSKTVSELPKSTSSVPKLNSFGSKFLPNTKRILTAEPKSAASISSTAIPSEITPQAERSTLVMSAYTKPLLPTTIIVQPAERSTSTTSANAKPSLPNLIPLMKSSIVEPEKVSTAKTVQKLTDLSGIENRRTLRTIDSSINQKEDKPMGSTGSNKRLLGNMGSKISPLATPRQQTLVPLKRKTPEAPDSVEVLVNNPKRHSDSSIARRRLLGTSGLCVDKEDGETLDRGDTKGTIKNCLLSPVQILPELNMQNLGSPYSIKDDNYIEKAEACSKELEDISNMLRKKHEEAKDLLVRAIINNNKLLMLNHPLYDEKIRMIQKFAACLSLGN